MSPIIKICAVLFIAGLLSWLIDTPLVNTLYKYKYIVSARNEEIFEGKKDYDVLFIGSSRTYRSVYPKIIDSICGTNSYNAGVESGGIDDFKLMLDGYLQNHPAPKVLVLTLDLFSFGKDYDVHFYPQYYPYINNQALKSDLIEYGHNMNVIEKFPFLMITYFDDYLKERAIRFLRGLDTLSTGPSADIIVYKGFESNSDFHIKQNEIVKVRERMSITKESIRTLNEMLEECNRHKIKVVFTYAPEYNHSLQRASTNIDSVFGLIANTAKKNNIRYIRDDSLEICKDPMLFFNNTHLNKQGAIVYSLILAKELNSILLPGKGGGE